MEARICRSRSTDYPAMLSDTVAFPGDTTHYSSCKPVSLFRRLGSDQFDWAVLCLL